MNSIYILLSGAIVVGVVFSILALKDERKRRRESTQK
jgi:hypothetical protein